MLEQQEINLKQRVLFSSKERMSQNKSPTLDDYSDIKINRIHTES